MKKLLCIILIILMLLPAAGAANENLPTMTLKLSGGAGKVGDTVTVFVSVENAPTCASFQTRLGYDEKVLKPIAYKQLGAGGIFLCNLSAVHEGKNIINALAADAAKVLEGTVALYSVDFEIIGECADPNGTPISVLTQEFYLADQTKVLNLVISPCRIPVVGSAAPSTPPAEQPPAEEAPTDTPTVDKPVLPTDEPTDTPTDEPAKAPETVLPDTKPTGNWGFTAGEVVHQENGTDTIYKAEYTKDPATGKVNGATLYDENGKEAGALVLEEKEDGSYTVTEQLLINPSAEEPKKEGLSTGVWIAVGAIFAVAIATPLIIPALAKKKKEESADE